MTITQFTIMLCISGTIVIWLMFLTFGYLDLKRDAEIDLIRPWSKAPLSIMPAEDEQ